MGEVGISSPVKRESWMKSPTLPLRRTMTGSPVSGRSIPPTPPPPLPPGRFSGPRHRGAPRPPRRAGCCPVPDHGALPLTPTHPIFRHLGGLTAWALVERLGALTILPRLLEQFIHRHPRLEDYGIVKQIPMPMKPFGTPRVYNRQGWVADPQDFDALLPENSERGRSLMDGEPVPVEFVSLPTRMPVGKHKGTVLR